MFQKMDLTLVNSVATNSFLPKKKLTELTISQSYKVTTLRQVKTMYGARVVVTLNKEFQVFLPPRFQKLFEKEPKLFSDMEVAAKSSQLNIVYHGDGKLEFTDVN